MEQRKYVLIDGQELVEYRMMTPEDAAEANERAKEATDGTYRWLELLDEPEPEPEEVGVHWDEFDRPYIPE